MATPSPFARRLASIAEEQHNTFHLLDEADPELCSQIKKYWGGISPGFKSCVSVPWSAVFVSWCVRQAGAKPSEFTFAAAHSVFVHAAIKNALAGTGVFHAVDISDREVGVGYIIQNNRGGTKFDYAFARSHKNYASHSAIVIETGQDGSGRYALTVGGNEGNSVRRTIVRLANDGIVKQRKNNPFISVIEPLK